MSSWSSSSPHSPWLLSSPQSPASSSSPLPPRVFTIYPDDQGPNRDPPLEVELQRSFTGPYAIPACLADQTCDTFGVHGLLSELNTIMGTSFPLSPYLKYNLNRCISLNYDFGLAYSYLAPQWFSDWATFATRMDRAEYDDAALRRDAVDASKKFITNPRLPPRRVWDIYSNRVIPYHWWGGNLESCMSVSHSWPGGDKRSDVWSTINGRKWPIPIPSDSSLERVRIELLNHVKLRERRVWGIREYSWLDVLCIRQTGGEQDDAHCAEEWMIDLPTLGYIYNAYPDGSEALIYFNGLGRPFYNGGYDNPRHWFNRAWHVQEAVERPFFGGATPSSPILFSQQPRPEFHKFHALFKQVFRSKTGGTLPFSQYITMVRERDTEYEVDRVTGLAGLSSAKCLPIFNLKHSSEDAWELLVQVINSQSRVHLFFWYPKAGDRENSWRPSWSQIMVEGVPAAESHLEYGLGIDYDETRGVFQARSFHVHDNCSVLELDLTSLERSSGSSVVRVGRIIVEGRGIGSREVHEVEANHSVPINATGRYTCLFSDWGNRFVVGAKNSANEIQKVCVFDFKTLESANDIRRIACRRDVDLI